MARTKFRFGMKAFFNLIEVTIAIGVIGIGIASIMGLFPVAIQAHRDANTSSYSGDVADQMLHFLAAACKNDWNTYISSSAAAGNITSTVPTMNTSYDNLSNWTSAAGNIYTISGVNNVFGIKQGSAGTDDFTAHARVWKAQISTVHYADGSWQAASNLDYDKAARLYVELSWPVNKPYSARDKKVFCLELFNPNG